MLPPLYGGKRYIVQIRAEFSLKAIVYPNDRS